MSHDTAQGGKGSGSAQAAAVARAPTPQVHMKKKIVVVEDHESFRESLIELLVRLPDVEVSGAYGSAEEALAHLPDGGTDLVLVDLSLPGMNGFELETQIKNRFPSLPCVMLTGYRIPSYVERARKMGFQGYVVKGDSQQLRAVVTDVLAGKTSFPQFE